MRALSLKSVFPSITIVPSTEFVMDSSFSRINPPEPVISTPAGVDITGSGGLILENDESITNSVDGTIVIDGKTDFNDNALTGYGHNL